MMELCVYKEAGCWKREIFHILFSDNVWIPVVSVEDTDNLRKEQDGKRPKILLCKLPLPSFHPEQKRQGTLSISTCLFFA